MYTSMTTSQIDQVPQDGVWHDGLQQEPPRQWFLFLHLYCRHHVQLSHLSPVIVLWRICHRRLEQRWGWRRIQRTDTQLRGLMPAKHPPDECGENQRTSGLDFWHTNPPSSPENVYGAKNIDILTGQIDSQSRLFVLRSRDQSWRPTLTLWSYQPWIGLLMQRHLHCRQGETW